MSLSPSFLFLAGLTLLLPNLLHADPVFVSMQKVIRGPEVLAQPAQFIDASFGEGVWVAVSRSTHRHVYRSTDGVNWSPILLDGNAHVLTGVLHANGIWLAYSRNTGAPLLRSVDQGLTWEAHLPEPFLNEIAGAKVVDNRFVVYRGERLMVSADGLSWEQVYGILPGDIQSLHFFENSGAVVARLPNHQIFTAQGLGQPWQWTWGINLEGNFSGLIHTPVLAPSQWAIIQKQKDIVSRTSREHLFSTDGWRWTEIEGTFPAFRWIVRAGNTHYAFDQAFSSVFQSTDGIHWSAGEPITLPESFADAMAVDYGNGRWVVASDSSLFTATTPNGPWEQVHLNGSPVVMPDFVRMATNGDTLVAVGRKVLRVDVQTDQTVEFELPEVIRSPLHWVIWDSTRYVAVGDEASILVSSDGLIWERIHHQSNGQAFASIAYGPQGYLALNASGLYLSSDLMDWESVYAFEEQDIRDAWVGYYDDRYVSISWEYGVKVSFNARDWIDTNVSTALSDIHRHEDRWFGNYRNQSFESTDGVEWNNVSPAFGGLVLDGGDGVLLAAHAGMLMYASTSGGDKWSQLSMVQHNSIPSVGEFKDSLYADGRFFFLTAHSQLVSLKVTDHIPSDGPGQIYLTGGSVQEGNVSYVQVNRQGGIQGEVSVRVSTTNLGSATPGLDFEPQSTVITWSDGQTGPQFPFGIPTHLDQLAEGTETIVLQLTEPTGGVEIPEPTASVYIMDHPFDDWRFRHFPEDPEGIGAPWADPDGDGMPNWLEYALGLNPRVPDREHLEAITRPIYHPESRSLTLMIPFSYQFHSGSGAGLSFRSSTDLATWEEQPFHSWVHGSSTHEGRNVRYVRIPVPEGGDPTFLQTLFHFGDE